MGLTSLTRRVSAKLVGSPKERAKKRIKRTRESEQKSRERLARAGVKALTERAKASLQMEQLERRTRIAGAKAALNRAKTAQQEAKAQAELARAKKWRARYEHIGAIVSGIKPTAKRIVIGPSGPKQKARTGGKSNRSEIDRLLWG